MSAADQEMVEAMMLREDDLLREHSFLGVGMDLTTSKPEFIFFANLKERASVYERRFEQQQASLEAGEPGMEFSRLVTARQLAAEPGLKHQSGSEAGELRLNDIVRIREQLVPACQAGLLAYWLSLKYLSPDDERYDSIDEFEANCG